MVQTSEHAPKSVLLELAKLPEPEAQRELWEEMKARTRRLYRWIEGLA